ncbi:uncharacterized protein F5Z01DRAFT_750322 [Emericellopsis atlantica]|uniref:Uncharacterized protein n=1 Tax=Emericellopsis atlantica TaxID=2614577 RepID=A0A9P8CR77_9HYPO|nr:uncharacterized protein F5Z01DRAFT_750322 [Emericellopsis atlantica]KAG9254431.1 hypothetical protein F5Z01DRAFT_750322 [Emericellopsis atlantica]
MSTKAPFNLRAAPSTDLWRIPPSTDRKNGNLIHASNALTSLKSATISFKASYIHQFDQAGLIVRLTHPSHPLPKWIKTGIEYFDGEPRISVVCCDNYSDWSVASLPASISDAVTKGEQEITIRLEVKETTVWIYRVGEDGKDVPLREIAWLFADGGKGWTAEIGACVARPAEEPKDEFEATFTKLDVQWK